MEVVKVIAHAVCLISIFGSIALAAIDYSKRGREEIENERFETMTEEMEIKRKKDEEVKARIFEEYKDHPEILHGRMYGHLFGYDEVEQKLMEARKKDEERNRWHF